MRPSMFGTLRSLSWMELLTAALVAGAASSPQDARTRESAFRNTTVPSGQKLLNLDGVKPAPKRLLDTKPSIEVHEKIGLDEGLTIQEIPGEFLLTKDEFGNALQGILMDSTGEPKSGTTYIERLTTELAVQLCGSDTNKWCKMGVLKVLPNIPDPSYTWEMVHADTGEMYMHFAGWKHLLPGVYQGPNDGSCNPRGRRHGLGFQGVHPCRRAGTDIAREDLSECLPETSGECAKYLPTRDPASRRMSVVFRDTRNLVISEHRMKTGVFHKEGIPDLPDFIRQRFEIILAWQTVRWVWHTTYFASVSHVMFYEDFKESFLPVKDLANFMGLECSLEQAERIWDMHKSSSSHGEYETYGLPVETIEWMNASMSRLLPLPMVHRYGLVPTDR